MNPFRSDRFVVAIGRAIAVCVALGSGRAIAQERSSALPPLQTFETDADGDGVPDGWYNLRDARLVRGGKSSKSKTRPASEGLCLRFSNDKPSRPARASTAFAVDGRATEALIVGLWVRLKDARPGERQGEEPAVDIVFLNDDLITCGRGFLGPWTDSIGDEWVHVVRRIPVPRSARDAILTLGLLGGTGTLWIDGLSIEAVPAGGVETRNLVRNPGFELGDPAPEAWVLGGGAERVFPGRNSDAAVRLKRYHSRVLFALGVPVEHLGSLQVEVEARAVDLRLEGGAVLAFFFLDEDGRPLADPAGAAPVVYFGGGFGWRRFRGQVAVPRGAVRAVVQFEKEDGNGLIDFDNLVVTAENDRAGTWTPYHVADDRDDWTAYKAEPAIEPGSALDASTLLDAPAGKHGPVVVRDGRLTFSQGRRALFFGATLIPTAAFQSAERADALADRIARTGINLVRLSHLDAPLGPGQSLLDDARDDTRALDPEALAKLDHLIAALKARGVYVALELISSRRFRSGDGVEDLGDLPPGGGGASAFDPRIRARIVETAELLLSHVNPETGLALRDDPVLAWVTIAGEQTVFDRQSLSVEAERELLALGRKSPLGTGRKFLESVEAEQWRSIAEALRKSGLKAPIAGGSHTRREPNEYLNATAASGLDLIDDRLVWAPPDWGDPARRSFLWSPDALMAFKSRRKRRPDRPYVVGQWCDQTFGVWANPFEGGELLLAALTGREEDWDGLVRRGIAAHPEVWGANAVGTGVGNDTYVIPEAFNGNPQVFALWPHAACLFLKTSTTRNPKSRSSSRFSIPGWDPSNGRLVIDTPRTQGFAGRIAGEPAKCADLSFDLESSTDRSYGAIVVSALGSEPIAAAKRLLVTAVARVEPTGFFYADHNRLETGAPGRPPLLQEPVRAKIVWHRKGKIAAYRLDNAGKRLEKVPPERGPGNSGAILRLDGKSASTHWELAVE